MNLQATFQRRLILGIVGAALFGVCRNAAARVSVERIELPNRLTVFVSEDHSLPFVTLKLLIDAGVWRDPVGKGGLANLAAKSMLLGTKNRSESEINESLDFTGSSLDIACGWDYVTLSLKSLKKELDRGLDIFAEILLAPAFPDAEFQREKEKILGSIEAARDNPGKQSQLIFRQAVFAAGPYGHPSVGTEETLGGLTRQDVTEFYRAYYRPNIGILAIVGDITVAEIKAKLVPLLSGWLPAEVPDTPVETKFAEGPQVLKKDRPISQANIVLGHGGIRRSNPDYYAVTLMNRILGGGAFSSRLMEIVRVQKGLAYSVSSGFRVHRFPGSFQVVLQTKGASAAEAIRLVLQEMKRMQQEPVAEAELETARKYLIGSFPLRLATQAGLAGFIGRAIYYDLGLDFPERYPALIRAVTRGDVLRAARQYLHPEDYFVSIVGNMEEIERSVNAGSKP